MSKVTGDLGLWWQSWLSSLAESGRETGFSAISMGFQAGYQSVSQTQINTMISENNMDVYTASQQETSYAKKAKIAKALELSMSTLSLFGPVLGMLAGGGIGSSMMAGFSLMGSMELELSELFEAVANQHHKILSQIQEAQRQIRDEIAQQSAIYDIIAEDEGYWSELALKEPQISSQAIPQYSDPIVENTMMMHPVLLPGMKNPIDTITGNKLYFKMNPGDDNVKSIIDEDIQQKKKKKMKALVQQTTDGKSLLPSKAERIISREFGGKKQNTQKYMKNLWKLGKLEGEGDNYIFGMIYQWTHEKSGRVLVYPGRTERRKGTPNYRPYSPISVRFDEEIRIAIESEIGDLLRRKCQMYYDMRIVYDKAGRGQKGINAIVKNFKLEIVELQVMSEYYEKDKLIIEQLEDYWSDVANLKGYELYTKVGGRIGSHVSELKGAHGRKSSHNRAREMIQQGFSKKEIAQYFNFPWSSITHTSAQLDTFLKEALNGKSYTMVRNEEISSEILNLIDNGILTISELASNFRGMTSKDIFNYLKAKQFPKGNLYLNGLISSKILKLQKNLVFGKFVPVFTYSDISNELGIRSGDLLLAEYMKRELKVITKVTVEDLISWLKPYARILIKHCNSAIELLTLLNWDRDLTSQLVDERIKILFGLDFKQAKMIFTSGVLNK